MTALNPDYFPPTRKTLSNTILTNAYHELQASIATVQTQKAVLLIDGYKNKATNTNNVVTMLRLDELDNRKYIFLNSWNFSDRRETAQALSEVVEECIIMARERYELEIHLVISDNVACMIAMGRIVAIWHVTCSAHSGNLLAKALVDVDFARQVNTLLKEFKNPALEAQLLQRGGNRMVLVGETRWCTHRNAFSRALRNLNQMRAIAEEDQRGLVSHDSRQLLFDPGFEMTLQNNINILNPVCQLINTSQRADCTIADATELWLRLQEVPGNNEEHMRLIRFRQQRAIHVYGLAANFLHPRYQGRAFANDQIYVNQVEQFFVESLEEEGLAQLEIFRNRAGLFQNMLQRDFRSGLVFWKTVQDFYPELSELAIKLHLAPASTGQLERLFSEWAYVHHAKRNRLSEERSSQLIAIYYDTRFNDQVMMDDLLDLEENEENE